MKNDIPFIYKENMLSALTNDFERDRPLKLAHIDTLQLALTTDEMASSADTIAIMKMRSLLAEGDPFQAYKTFIAALKADPLNLSLQIEYFAVLNALADKFKSLLTDSPNSPLIDAYYDILYREAYLNNHLQTLYMSYLINQERYAESLQLALPLIELFPAMLGLRDAVERIAITIPDPRLTNFLRTPLPRVGRQTISSKRTPAEVLHLKTTFHTLIERIHLPEIEHYASKMFDETLGELNESSPIDTSLKDIYYLKALYEGNRGKHWAAIELLQSLVEIDQCNLFYRRSLQVEVQRFCTQKELNVDPRIAYAALREFAVVPFVMIKTVALAHVKNGEVAKAKGVMRALVELNSFDNDYLLATLEVATESKDQKWIDEISLHITDILKNRPWDLALRAAVDT